jgi:hypothetical protein
MILAIISAFLITAQANTGQSEPQIVNAAHTVIHGNFIYENRETVVCDIPSQITHMSEMNGSPYFINFGNAYPNNYLTILVWENDAHTMEINPLNTFGGSSICIKGVVRNYRSRPQIVLRSHDQIVSITPINKK